MTSFLQFTVLGFSSGAIYLSLALGLLVVYRATAVLNFAQGALAMWSACVFVVLRSRGVLVLPIGSIDLGSALSWPVALLASLVTGVVLSAVVYALVFRPLRSAPILGQVVASIALMVSVLALAQIRFGANALTVPRILPARTLTVASVPLDLPSLLLAGIGIVLCVAMWAFSTRTTTGIAMRAAAVNGRALTLMGYSPSALGLAAWVLGAVVSVLGVVLAAPATGLDETNFTLYVIPALAVLLVARLRSVWVVAIASLVLGSFQSVITFYSSQSWWPTWGQVGLQDALPFAVIVIALFVFGGRLPARGSTDAASLPKVRIPELKVTTTLVPCGVVLVALLSTHGTYRFGVITSITVALIALSYVLITGYLGQISLAQIAFAGAAGFMLSKLTTSWDVPFPLSLLVSALVAGGLGLLVAVPAFRIRGTQLAIVTIAAAVTMQEFVFSNPSLTPVAGNAVGEPTLFGLNLSVQRGHDIATLAFGITTLVVAAAFFALFVVLARGSTGRAWLAVRSNERAAASAGVDVRAVKLAGFAISAVIAGSGGALIGYSRGQLSASSFTVSTGLLMLAVTYLGGMTSVSGALVAGAIGPLGLVYVVLNAHIAFGKYYALVAGLGLIVSTVLNPLGLAGKTYEQWLWFRASVARHRTTSPPTASPQAASSQTASPQTIAAAPKVIADGGRYVR